MTAWLVCFLGAIALTLSTPTSAEPDLLSSYNRSNVNAKAVVVMVGPDKNMDRAAEEFVAEYIPMDDARLARARGGQVQPPCKMPYPDTLSKIGGENFDSSPEFKQKMRDAVDFVVIKQNMIAAGLRDSTATWYADNHREEQQKFRELPSAEQTRHTRNHNSPAWRLPGLLNAIVKPADLPHFKDPEDCYQGSVLTKVTPYRFLLAPSGGRIWVIPTFMYRYCQLRYGNPYSSGCTAWLEVVDGQDADLIGKYAYSAEWPAGEPRRGILNFRYVDEQVRTIRINQPGD